MSPGSAYALMHHWIGEVEGHAGAWGRVHGGMGAVSWCLAEAARAASPVVSSAHPKTTYLDLVGEEHLPPEVVRDIRRYRTRSAR